jgi:hypothetical protein
MALSEDRREAQHPADQKNHCGKIQRKSQKPELHTEGRGLRIEHCHLRALRKTSMDKLVWQAACAKGD